MEFLKRCQTWKLFAAAACLVALVYLPTAKYDFIGLDDPEYILENDRVLTGLTLSNAAWAVTSCGFAANWHPLAWISLQADASLAHRLYGKPDNLQLSRVMHTHGVALHVLAACLLMLLIWRVTGNRYAALFFVLLWAIHPLRTEVVCWVTERKELSCVVLMLGALNCWISRGGTAVWRVVSYGGALALFALALTAKPLAVTLPCLLLAWDWVACRRTFVASLLRTLPFFALSAVAGVLTILAQSEPMTIGRRFTAVERIVMTLNAPIIYLRQTIWPAGLASYYPIPPPLHLPEMVLGVALLLVMIWVCVRWLRKRERWAGALAIGVAWSYIGLLPMLGIVKVGDQSHSDRYTYWVGCGIAALAAWFVAYAADSGVFRRLWQRHWWNRLCWGAAGVLALAVLLTAFRVPVWRNRLTHYGDSAHKYYVSAAVVCYSRALRKQGREGTAAAERFLREAIMHNDNSRIRAEYACVRACSAEPTPLWKSGSGRDPAFTESYMDAKSALAADPKEFRAYLTLGIIDLRSGLWESAESNLRKAREIMLQVNAEREDVESADMFLDLCKRQADEKR